MILLVMQRSAQVWVKPELARQVFGYWFSPSDEIPYAPVGRPTGAVLPRLGANLHAHELLCLDLVPVDNYWVVLSEVGRYTYRHTTGLHQGEQFRFVPVPEAVNGWPVEFSVAYAKSIEPHEIVDSYGIEAAERARPDAPAVQLVLVRRG